ncbi:MAG: DUF2225 domain-containing protein [Bacillota bacterium]|nr:DUF2225 domain-containing protein [Bacillota bacterium]
MDNGQKDSKLFSDLEYLGFNKTDNWELYGSNTAGPEKQAVKEVEENKEKTLLYEREVICPVCETRFNARAVKVSAARTVSKDSDFFIRYSVINPYFYDVWVCNSCGYASMKKDFEYIKEHQIEHIKKNITSRWRGRKYPETYDLDIAIERYKLSLLNYAVRNAKNSSKAMNCLKIAWMYRLKEDVESEQTFLLQTLEGLENAYYNEDFPMYGMDRFTTMYLIGELSRRTGNDEKAMQWFSKVITTTSVSPKLKDLARDQKDLIKFDHSHNDTDLSAPAAGEPAAEGSKKGFFRSIFRGL